MSREIEFRGKRCADGVWVYGDYVAGDSCDVSFIFPCDITSLFCVGGRYEVYENTIGQFTGMTDKNGVKIFEGDIVEVYDFTSVYADKYRGVVKMYRGSWCVEYEDSILDMVAHPRLFFDDFADKKTEVVGNIHDK